MAAPASACDAVEYWHDPSKDTLRVELMVETTQSIFAADGTVALPRLIADGRGRIGAAHFGTYDYTAACGITAGASAHDASRVRLREARDAGRARGDGHLAVRRRDQHHAAGAVRGLYGFFLEGFDAASERLWNFLRKAAQATRAGDVFDGAATAQGVLNYLPRAVNWGAITKQEALDGSGLTLVELRGRSFLTILANRRRS